MRIDLISGSSISTSGSFKASATSNSAAKEGGELFLPDGSVFDYENRDDLSQIPELVKAFEKETLLDKKDKKEIEFKGNKSGDKEWSIITFSLHETESQYFNEDLKKEIRNAVKEGINEFVETRAPGSKAMMMIDNFHTDTDNHHFVARIHKYPQNLEKNTAVSAKDATVDLSKSSQLSEISSLIEDKIKELNIEGFEAVVDNKFSSPSSNVINEIEKKEKEKQTVEVVESVDNIKPESTTKIKTTFSPEAFKIAEGKQIVADEITNIEDQIRKLQAQKAFKEEFVATAIHAEEAIKQKVVAIEEKEIAISEKNAAVKELNESKDYHSYQLKNKDVEIAHNESKIEKLNEFLTTEKQNTAELETTVEKFSDKNNELIAEVEDQKEKADKFKEELELLKDELKDKVEDITKLDSENSMFKDDLEAVQSKNETLIKEIEGKEKEVEIQKKSIDSLLTQNSELKKDLEEIEKDKDDLRNDKQDLKNDNSSLKSENTELNQKNGELENELKGLAQQMQEMQAKMFGILESQNKTLAENSALVEQVQQLSAKMDSLSVTQTIEKDSDDKSQIVEALKNIDKPEKPAISKEAEAKIIKAMEDRQAKADQEKADADKSKNKDNDSENDR